MTDSALSEKLGCLKESLRAMGRVAVAFSGGVDSTFVLKVAVETLGSGNVLAVTGQSETLAREDFEESVRTAGAYGVEHVVLATNEMANSEYARNASDRCYHCKRAFYEQAHAHLRERSATHTIVSGTNADDLGDWRPGLRAAEEQGVRSPAAEAGMTKADIRALLREWGLPAHDRPASPCLASRIAYGEEVTVEKLRMIGEAERFLRQMGLRELRVRHHGHVARIEVPPDRIAELAAPNVRARIDARLRELGFAYVALDLRGFRSGSLNEVIAFGKVQPPASR